MMVHKDENHAVNRLSDNSKNPSPLAGEGKGEG